LFLFLQGIIPAFAQKKYTLNIITAKEELPGFIKKKSYKTSFSDSVLLIQYLQKIKSQLIKDAYITASFDSIKFDSLTVNAFLYTGKKYQINTFNICGLSPALEKKYLPHNSKKKIQKTFNPAELNNIYKKIITEYENNAYPFASLTPVKVNLDGKNINLDLKLEKNTKIYFHKIFIKGKTKISPVFVKKYLSIKEGNTYNEESITSAEKKIKQLNFLSEIKPPEVDFFGNNADIYLYLKDKKANLIDGVIGFIPDKNNDNKLSFTGNINLNLSDNFNKGENIFLKWSKTAELSQKLNAGFKIPYFLKSPFNISAQFILDKRDTLWMNLSGKATLDFKPEYNSEISAYIKTKSSFIISPEYVDTSLFKNTSAIMFGFAYALQNLDYIFNPSEGFALNISPAAGKRTVNNIKSNYFETDLFAEYYLPLFSRFVLKSSAKLKYAFPYEDLCENELFDLGGFNSLRGFDENQFRTSAYALINAEIRYLYEKESSAFIFFNTATFKDNNNTADNKYYHPYGFGIGTSINTKAGIFSVSYALGALPENNLKISDSKIHIGYINRF